MGTENDLNPKAVMTRQDRDLQLLLDAGLPYEMAFEIAFRAMLDRQLLNNWMMPWPKRQEVDVDGA